MFKKLLSSLTVMLFAFSMNSEAQQTKTVLSDKPIHKVMLEEFAYMTCGNCPKGIVAFERLRAIYGEDIILISLHDKANEDPLFCKDFTIIENAHWDNSTAYPSVYIDRSSKPLDPYFGTSFEYDDMSKRVPLGIKEDIEKIKANIPAANIDASYSISGNILTATSKVRFFHTGDASDYGIGYILTADGLTNPDWLQLNYLIKNKTYEALIEQEPLFEPWVKGKNYMYGVVYNDIAIAGIGVENGVEGSVPTSVKEGEIYTHSVTFDLSKNSLIQDRNKLRLITVLFNNKTKMYEKLGKIENANSVLINEKTGIEEINTEGQVAETARYTIDGRKISKPEKGINIIKYSNGSIKKVVVK